MKSLASGFLAQTDETLPPLDFQRIAIQSDMPK
jgi:hypothetical protein